ncbi:VWA domain-containing protein [Streptomyces sp. NPDC101110]|uniref:VWA domain-containing protein n=1 Tax=Streptomyces sp. NPDC101110 TaxID=3366104 RepID=UPI003828B870
MGILTLLRNAFGRSRKSRTAEAEGAARTATAGETSGTEDRTAEHTGHDEAVTPAETTPAQAPASPTDPKVPSPSPEPKPTPTANVPEPRTSPSDEHDLVSAAFDHVAVPRPTRSTDDEQDTTADRAETKEPTAAEESAAAAEEPATAEQSAAAAEEPAAAEKPAAAVDEAAVVERAADEEPAAAEEPEKAEAEPELKEETPAEPKAETPAEPEPKPKAETPAEPEPEPKTAADKAAETAKTAKKSPTKTAKTASTTKVKTGKTATKPEKTPEPTAAEPATPEPAATEPAATEPATPEPAAAEPAAAEAAAADGGTAPQGPPAPDDESRTGGAGGKTKPDEAEGEDGPALPLTTLKKHAPDLATAYKAATTALKKNDLTGTRAKVYLVLDRSASMRPYYKDGSAQALAEQTLALAAHLDPEATVPVVFFSTELDGTGEITLTEHENKIDDLHADLGRMGRTSYHAAVEAVLAHHDKTADPATPALVVFQTDGAPDAKTPATQALTDAAESHPAVFFSFVAFGDPENKAFDYLRKLKTPNTSHFLAGETPRELTDKELYEGVLANWRP